MLSLATYRSTSGRDEVVAWFDDLDDEDQADVLATIIDLLKTPRARWDRPEYGHLKGKNWKGFFEIILKPKGIQIRLVGYWRFESQFAVVLVHNKNKGGKLKSSDSDTARLRRNAISDDPTRAGVWMDENAIG